MYNYTRGWGSNLQLLRKHCFTLDQNISAIMNFIDLVNANYVVLNFVNIAGGNTFYPKDFIQSQIVDIENSCLYLNKIHPHQILINNYGRPLQIYGSSSELLDVLEEGFALIRLNAEQEKNSYSIVSLDSSGTYYVLNNVTINEQGYLSTTWLYYPNAVDEVGRNYLFTIIPPGTRLIYWNRDPNDEDFHTCKNISNTPWYTFLQAYNADTLQPSLASINGSFWQQYLLLGYDIYTINTTTAAIEDIICDDIAETQQFVINNRPVSSSLITTNLQSCTNIKFYINYY